MHPLQTRHQFLKLRAQGLSFSKIAAALKVSKPTLLAWNRQHLAQVQSPRALQLQLLQDTLPDADLLRCAAQLRAIEQELVSRTLREIPTGQLRRLALELHERIRELHADNKRSTQGQELAKSL